MAGSAAPASALRDTDGRLRTSLRVALVIVAMLVAAGLTDLVHLWLPATPANAANAVLMGVLGLGLFTWLVRRLDRRPVRSLGLALDSRWWRDVAAGAVIGLLIGAVPLLLLLAGGWAQVTEVWSPGTAQPVVATALIAMAATTAITALWEELVFRGHLMSNAAQALARGRPPRRAVLGAWLISVPIFALIHGNQALDPRISPAVALLWLGMAALLGFAYAATGQLGLPIGIHFAANLALGPLFGLHGDLQQEIATVFRLALDGPEWLVDAGGALQLLGVAAAFLFVWLWLRLRGAPGSSGLPLDTSLAEAVPEQPGSRRA